MPVALLTTAEAKFQGVISKKWQPMWKRYFWTADGCGDNLYTTASLATQAYKIRRLLGVVSTEGQLQGEHA